MTSSARKLFVTTALPYANGNFHIGHIMEYIQADIWVRTQRLLGNEVNFVGADDTHGAPIMIAAETAAKPVLKQSEHFFFKLSDPRCVAFLEDWTPNGRLQPEVANKVREWF